MLQKPEKLLPCSSFAGKKNEMYRLETQFYFFNSNLKTIAVRFIKLLSNIFATIKWIYCMDISGK